VPGRTRAHASGADQQVACAASVVRRVPLEPAAARQARRQASGLARAASSKGSMPQRIVGRAERKSDPYAHPSGASAMLTQRQRSKDACSYENCADARLCSAFQQSQSLKAINRSGVILIPRC